MKTKLFAVMMAALMITFASCKKDSEPEVRIFDQLKSMYLQPATSALETAKSMGYTYQTLKDSVYYCTKAQGNEDNMIALRIDKQNKVFTVGLLEAIEGNVLGAECSKIMQQVGNPCTLSDGSYIFTIGIGDSSLQPDFSAAVDAIGKAQSVVLATWVNSTAKPSTAILIAGNFQDNQTQINVTIGKADA